MSWLSVVPGLVGLAALWTLPGYAVVRLLGVRGLVAWGVGPAVTSGYAGVAAVAYGLLGVTWSLGTFLLAVLAAALVALGLGLGLGTLSHPAGVRPAGQRALVRPERLWLAAAWVLGGGVLGAAMMTGMRHADQPPQAWDAVFHLNALWFIRDTGNGSSLGGLAPMYGDTVAPYYPAVWHSVVAVAPGFEQVTEAANASSVVLGSVVWIGGLVALARVVWPRTALPVVLTPVLAASYVTFPAIAVSMLGVWPFALSVACLPGTLALMISTFRRDLGWRLHTAYGIALAWAVAGVVLSHGSGLFSLVLLAAPLLVVLLGRQARRYWRRGHRALVGTAVVVGTVVAVTGSVVVLSSSPVEAIVSYERGGQPTYWPGIGALLIDHPLIYVYDIRSVNLAVTALVVTGVVLSLRRRHARWLVVALALSVVLTLLAAGPPENPLRVLAGFWYTQASRINQLLVVPAVMLAAGGGAWVAHRLARWRDVSVTVAALALVVGVVALTSGLRWSMHVQVMSSTYSTWPIAWGTMLEEDEIAMVDRAAETLPEGAVVLGEPTAGSPYLLHRSDVAVVYPQLTPVAGSPERLLLAERFDEWQRTPAVCEAVRALGVTHVYADDLTFDEGAKWEEATPGLRTIRTDGPDFALVDEGGQASLWRFTGCDR
ncbi:DUF6541 family protein [Ornithinimicrobium sediminis]|uniref:DUF6541 family protein n=1 Tax=Ornithinimicrobium sediminis TaxID=2904603 RepID=UPI001E632942|nr:DUF6541 family protein [Ornithinimicrobium sediminis]MCE0487849.1 hypothetical protein [Ornithinimicrobium sediminis]